MDERTPDDYAIVITRFSVFFRDEKLQARSDRDGVGWEGITLPPHYFQCFQMKRLPKQSGIVV